MNIERKQIVEMMETATNATCQLAWITNNMILIYQTQWKFHREKHKQTIYCSPISDIDRIRVPTASAIHIPCE